MCVVANHHPRIISGQLPLGQSTSHFVHFKKCFDKFLIPHGIDDGEKRQVGTKGIPQRKNRIIVKPFGHMNLMIHSTVSFVHIFKNIWGNGRVVKPGVKNTPLSFRSTFHVYFRQESIPLLLCIFRNFFKIPCRIFSFKVFPGTINIYCRNADLHHNLFVFLRIKLKERSYILPFSSVYPFYQCVIQRNSIRMERF